MSQRRLKNVFTRTVYFMIRLENVWKMFLQDVAKISWRPLEYVLKTFLQDALQTSWQEVVLKICWRLLEDVIFFFFFLIWIKIVKSNFQLVEIRPLPALLDYPSALLSNKDALLLKWNFSKSNFDLILLLLNKQFLHFFISYVWNILTHISHI